MDSLTTMPIITTTWMTTKMSIMPIVSIVTLIRINNAPHVHHVDHFHHVIHAQAEKDAAMKQAESASRAAEMFMKVFIVRYKLSLNLTRNLLETLPSCFLKNLSIERRPYLPRITIRMEALETALALVMLVRKHTHHAISKKVPISSFLGLYSVTNSILPDFS